MTLIRFQGKTYREPAFDPFKHTKPLREGMIVWASARHDPNGTRAIQQVEIIHVGDGGPLFDRRVRVRGRQAYNEGVEWWTDALLCDASLAELYYRLRVLGPDFRFIS